MSSKSKSSSSTATTTENTDARVLADNGAIVVSDDGSVTVLDGGAIELAQEVALEALDTSLGIADISAKFAFDALGFVKKNNSETSEILQQVVGQTRDESAQLGAQIIRLGIPAIALILIVRGWGK